MYFYRATSKNWVQSHTLHKKKKTIGPVPANYIKVRHTKYLLENLERLKLVLWFFAIQIKKKIQTWLIWLDKCKTVDHHVRLTEFILAYGLRQYKGFTFRILPDQVFGIRNIKWGIIFNLPWINLLCLDLPWINLRTGRYAAGNSHFPRVRFFQPLNIFPNVYLIWISTDTNLNIKYIVALSPPKVCTEKLHLENLECFGNSSDHLPGRFRNR